MNDHCGCMRLFKEYLCEKGFTELAVVPNTIKPSLKYLNSPLGGFLFKGQMGDPWRF